MNIILYIFLIMLCFSPFGLFHLVAKYGSNWKFKDLKTKDKIIYLSLWTLIALWLGLIISTVCKLW